MSNSSHDSLLASRPVAKCSVHFCRIQPGTKLSGYKYSYLATPKSIPALSPPRLIWIPTQSTFQCKDAQVFHRVPLGVLVRFHAWLFLYIHICSLATLVSLDLIQVDQIHSTCLRYVKYQLWNLDFFFLYYAFMNDDVHNGSGTESAISGQAATSHAYRRLTAYPVSISVSVRMSTECIPGEIARKSIRTD